MEQTSREKKIYRVTILGSIVNLFLLFFKFLAGILGHSAAMIADAVHSLSDFITDIIVIIFVKISSKPADKKHENGHGKYETLATSIIGFILAGIGISIGYNGISKIIDVINGNSIESPGIIALIAALVSIFSKEAIFRITKRVSKDVNSSALEANAWHHRSDALSSIGTAIGIGGAIILGDKWTVLDPIAAVIVSIFIIISSFEIIRESLGELLESSLPIEVEETIIKIAAEEPNVTDVHNIHTRKVGNRMMIEMHIRMPDDMTIKIAHDHATNIEKRIKQQLGSQTHIMLHIEPINE